MKSGDIKDEAVTVLLVEDNHSHAELVMRILEDHKISHKIYHVTNGEVALDYLFRRKDYASPEKSPRPHVILLDLRLPRIDGLEVLKEIRKSEKHKNIPVVILTTSREEQDIAGAYENSANSYLVKPIDFEKFTKLIDSFGYYWLGLNHYP